MKVWLVTTETERVLIQHSTLTISRYVLTSGIVYFPMRWSLQEKFNKVIGQIHVPVKSFTKHLKPSVYDTFVRMKPESPVWRANWAVFNDLEG